MIVFASLLLPTLALSASGDPEPLTRGPGPSLNLGARITGGAGASDVEAQATLSGGLSGTLILRRVEFGIEVGAATFSRDENELELWGSSGVRFGGVLGYRAPVGERMFIPLRARGGGQIVTSSIESRDLPGHAIYLGGSAALGVHLTRALDVELTFLDLQSYFYTNDFGGLEAALAFQLGLGASYTFAL